MADAQESGAACRDGWRGVTELRHITEQQCREITRSAVSSMSLADIFITPEEEAQHAAWLFQRVNDPEWREAVHRKWRGEGQE